MKAPLSIPDQEASGCRLTWLPGLLHDKASVGPRGLRGAAGTGGRAARWTVSIKRDSGPQGQTQQTPVAPQELCSNGRFKWRQL